MSVRQTGSHTVVWGPQLVAMERTFLVGPADGPSLSMLALEALHPLAQRRNLIL